MRLKLSLLILGLTPFAARLTPRAAAQSKSLPEVRSLGAADASVILGMNSNPSIRVLSNGRILATDLFSRRLIMVGADMKSIDTVFDATTPPPLTYPPGFSQLVPGLADTTLFFDSGARGYRVLDPSGQVVRRLSIADPSLMRALQSPASNSMLDPSGRMVLATQRSLFDKPISGLQPQAESLVVARVSVDRPGWDSVAAIMGSGQRTAVMTDSATNLTRLGLVMSLVDRGDAWTITPNGTVVIVRSMDFHVDWIAPDGSRRRSPSVPWSWVTYTRSQRDSIRSARVALMNTGIRRTVSSNGAAAPSNYTPPPQIFDTMPERTPAFSPSSIRTEPDGRIWIELGARVMGPSSLDPVVYGILDANGQIVERVELPARRSVVGFDRQGFVYAVTTTGTREGFAVERYRYRKP